VPPNVRQFFLDPNQRGKPLRAFLYNMTLYRAHFLDHGGNVFSVEDFHAEHDEAAKSYAAEVFQSTIGKGYEIWQGDRLVHAEDFFLIRGYPSTASNVIRAPRFSLGQTGSGAFRK
jgi:hypothetical protein